MLLPVDIHRLQRMEEAAKRSEMLNEKLEQKEAQNGHRLVGQNLPIPNPHLDSFYLHTISKLLTEVQQTGLVEKSNAKRKLQK